MVNTAKTVISIVKLAPIPKLSAGPTGKSGAVLSQGGKSQGKSYESKSSTSSFGSTSKSSSSKASASGKLPTFGTSKPSSYAPSTSKKSYDIGPSFAPKSGKSSFGIIWIPTKKRSKQKDLVYSSIYDDRKRERSPSMYNYMSGDSSDLQKKKDEEATLLVPERLKGPIATVASAGTAATIAELPSENADAEEKLLKRDNEENKLYQKEAAGDANDKDNDYLENKETIASNPTTNPEEKKKPSVDKVDSVYVTQTAIKLPPQSTASAPEEEDCGIKCLYYTLQCCDCVLM